MLLNEESILQVLNAKSKVDCGMYINIAWKCESIGRFAFKENRILYC